MHSLHGLLNCAIGGLDCRVITREYRTRIHSIHRYHLFYNGLVHVIYSGVSGQCSYTIPYRQTVYHVFIYPLLNIYKGRHRYRFIQPLTQNVKLCMNLRSYCVFVKASLYHVQKVKTAFNLIRTTILKHKV